MKNISKYLKLALLYTSTLHGMGLMAQKTVVTGTLNIHESGKVECTLNYPYIEKNCETVLFLDTACHMRYIRSKKRKHNERVALDWNPARFKNCYNYSVTASEKESCSLPRAFTVHYCFYLDKAEASAEKVQEALSLSSVRNKLLPTLYNVVSDTPCEPGTFDLFLEKKEAVGMSLHFIELDNNDVNYFALSGIVAPGKAADKHSKN